MRRRPLRPAAPPAGHPFPGLDLAWGLLAALPLSAPAPALADAAIPTPPIRGAPRVEPSAKAPPKPEGKADGKAKAEVRLEAAKGRRLHFEPSPFLAGVIAEVRTPDPSAFHPPRAPTLLPPHDESEDRRYFEAMAKTQQCTLHPHDPGTPCADLQPRPSTTGR